METLKILKASKALAILRTLKAAAVKIDPMIHHHIEGSEALEDFESVDSSECVDMNSTQIFILPTWISYSCPFRPVLIRSWLKLIVQSMVGQLLLQMLLHSCISNACHIPNRCVQ